MIDKTMTPLYNNCCTLSNSERLTWVAYLKVSSLASLQCSSTRAMYISSVNVIAGWKKSHVILVSNTSDNEYCIYSEHILYI